MHATLSVGGGASFAFQAGIPLKLIKILGDWYLDTVLFYLTLPLTIRPQSVNLFATPVISHYTTELQFGFGVLDFLFILILH